MTGKASADAITFSNVNFTFGERCVVKDFTESIATGEHVSFMGESGAGKSTLLNSIIGLTYPTSGEVKVTGLAVNAANIRKIRRLVAWLPQDANLPYQTVIEMLKAPYEFAVNSHLQFNEDAYSALLEKIGLDSEIMDKDLTTVSGGEKQRLMIVSAMMLNRKILLLDEPTSALDSLNRDKLTSLIESLSDTTILAITHDAEFAKTTDRIITLEKQ
jgi:putative ABC transport system ATP-binding protein